MAYSLKLLLNPGTGILFPDVPGGPFPRSLHAVLFFILITGLMFFKIKDHITWSLITYG
jgi:hypothetical protein